MAFSDSECAVRACQMRNLIAHVRTRVTNFVQTKVPTAEYGWLNTAKILASGR